MAIAITASRQKLNPTVTKNLTLLNKGVTVTGNKLTLPVVLDNLVVASYTVSSVTTANGEPTVTASANSFVNVRVGDAVTGTGIPASTTVTAINGTYSQLTLSANATASGTITLTVDPGTFDATVYLLEVTHVVSGSSLSITPVLYKMDGKKAANVNAGYDELEAADAVQTVPLASTTIDLDAYLANARVPRTNS